MAKLSLSQMEMYARSAGLPQPKVWAAIGMAESSGDPNIVNSINCVGIWQVNQPVWVKDYPKWTVAWLKNPKNNAKATATIYKIQGMKAWEAWTGPDGTGSDGPWREHFKGDADAAAAKLNGGPDLGEVADDILDNDGPLDGMVEVAEELGRIAQALAKAGNWLSQSHNWVRIGYVAGGGVLVYAGLAMVVQSTPAMKGARSALGVVATKGKTKAKSVRAASTARKAETARQASDAAKSQARVNEAYQKTRARAQARRDAKAQQEES